MMPHVDTEKDSGLVDTEKDSGLYLFFPKRLFSSSSYISQLTRGFFLPSRFFSSDQEILYQLFAP